MGKPLENHGTMEVYPLVICYIAIEAMAPSKVREFSQYNNGDFPKSCRITRGEDE